MLVFLLIFFFWKKKRYTRRQTVKVKIGNVTVGVNDTGEITGTEGGKMRYE